MLNFYVVLAFKKFRICKWSIVQQSNNLASWAIVNIIQELLIEWILHIHHALTLHLDSALEILYENPPLRMKKNFK